MASGVESTSVGGVFPASKSSSALEISAKFVRDVPWKLLSTVSVIEKFLIVFGVSTIAPVFAVATEPFNVQSLLAGFVVSNVNPAGI